MIYRILILISVAISCMYALKQIKDGYRRKYFIVAFCGMVALFFSRLFYLILCLSDGNDELMSLGVLGQSSAYLFFTTANTKFLTRKLTEERKHKICIPAIMGTILICTVFALSAIKNSSLSEYISDSFFIVFLGSSFYYAMTVICNRNKFEVCRYVTPFNICVCILIVINAFQILFANFTEGNLQIVLMTVLTVLSIPVLILNLPLLKRGMMAWEE